jgi:glycylpeptide N-tetradecanoyltransferase
MASYKFWQTQPVPSFGEKIIFVMRFVGANVLVSDEAKKKVIEEGPIKQIDPERVPKEPPPMYDGFEWVTMDLEDEKEVRWIYNLSRSSANSSTAARGLRSSI